MLYLCRVKPLRHYLRGFLIAAWAGDKIAEFSFPEISFHFRCARGSFCKPRVCGKACAVFKSTSMPGSPPHVRGKAGTYNELNNHQGSPPHARGKVECVIDTVGMRDHPRMCEERNKLRDGQQFTRITPHVRGKDSQGKMRGLNDRITPACAGKRLLAHVQAEPAGDHPRMCGKKSPVFLFTPKP